MNQVTLDKEEFRQIVETNKAKHEKLFHEASSAFYERVNNRLEELAQGVRAKKMNFPEVVEAINDLNRDHPKGHCDEYQDALDMLEHEVGDTVTLTPYDFDQYVKDKWNWTPGFTTSYMTNTGKAIG